MLPETGKAEGIKEGDIKRKKRRKDWNCKRNAKKRTRCKTNKWYYKIKRRRNRKTKRQYLKQNIIHKIICKEDGILQKYFVFFTIIWHFSILIYNWKNVCYNLSITIEKQKSRKK